LLDERLEDVDDSGAGVRAQSKRALGRLEREAALEHGALGERLPRSGFEQLPRSVERAAQRRVAWDGVTVGPLQQVEARRESFEQRARWQDLDARRGELDRQRPAVEASN